MKRSYISAATALLLVVVSTGAFAAPAPSPKSETRFEARDVASRVVKILKKVGKQLVPTILEDVIGTPKP
ncbi:MAG: hypothetical protein QOH21_1366 [Acidobacteriota bacterium]|nr:hypothetical protein [Acidobacteriota bacterium]